MEIFPNVRFDSRFDVLDGAAGRPGAIANHLWAMAASAIQPTAINHLMLRG
jgi:hypothetical protein